MATKKRTPAIRRRRRPQQEMSGFVPLMVVAMAAAALYSIDAVIIMAIGVMPTIVLGFTGKGEFKNERLQCVGFCNLAGIMPFMYQAKMRGWEVIVSDILSFVLMYGAAAVGYALVYVGPMVAAFVLQGLNEDRLKKIAQQRQALVELWSHEVLGDREEEQKQNAGKGFIR